MKLVILDRDGVINKDSDDYVKSPDEWIPIQGSLEAIARLNHFGYKVVVATNQSGLARGLFDIDILNAIHQKMCSSLDRVGGHVEGVFFCPHKPDQGCDCRKPKIGLLQQISRRMGTSIREVPVVGDSYRDIVSAQQLGASPLLVRTGKGLRTLDQYPYLNDSVPVYDDLNSAVDAMLDRSV